MTQGKGCQGVLNTSEKRSKKKQVLTSHLRFRSNTLPPSIRSTTQESMAFGLAAMASLKHVSGVFKLAGPDLVPDLLLHMLMRHDLNITAQLLSAWKNLKDVDMNCSNSWNNSLLKLLKPCPTPLGRTTISCELTLHRQKFSTCTLKTYIWGITYAYRQHSLEHMCWIDSALECESFTKASLPWT